MVQQRMDAFYFCNPNQDARDVFDTVAEQTDKKRLNEVCDVFIPEIFKRRYAGDPAYGYRYLTGGMCSNLRLHLMIF